MRIFYGVGSRLSCPLTVGEGRRWLSEELKDTKISRTACPIPGDRGAEARTPPSRSKRCGSAMQKTRRTCCAAQAFRAEGNSVRRGRRNGTGKSTMLKTVCGYAGPTGGKVMIDGKRIEKYKAEELFHGNLAMLPQDPQSLFVKKTVRRTL